MIKYYKNSIQNPKLKPVKNFSRAAWLQAINPNFKEQKKIAKLLKIDYENIEDATDIYELPRISQENGSLFIVLRTPVYKNNHYYTTSLAVIINQEAVATVATERINVLDDISQGSLQVYTTQRSNFFIKICLGLIKNYESYINQINRNVEQERRRVSKITQKGIVKLIESEEVLNEFVSSLSPTINIIKKTINSNYIKLYEKDEELINDLIVDAEQVRELAATNLRTIRNIRDGYATLVSLRLNQVMKILTYATVLLTVPMIVTGFYGMNISLPFATHSHSYLYISGFTILLVVVFLIIILSFRKKI